MENQKSYNPFKMWGSWFGFILGVVSFPTWEHYKIFLLNPISWLIPFVGDFFSYGILIYVIALFSIPLVLFFYGWVIHAIFRKLNRENLVVISVIILLIVASPVTYVAVKDQQEFKATLNSADSDIQAARASSDLTRELVAMNAIMTLAQAETDMSRLMDKLLPIASDESFSTDIRLTSLDALMPKVGSMSSDQKKNLNNQLVLLGNQVDSSAQLRSVDKERMQGRITRLQQLIK